MPTADPYRLPRTVLPVRYDLELTPDLEAASFRGTVTISVEVVEPVGTITLNALDLDIGAVRVRGGGVELDATVTDDPGLERVTLHLDGTLPAGAAEIHLAFDGTLNDQLVGFYRSTFELDGATTALAVTQFESTHARRAFPCFDEPDMKATFAITLVVDSGLLAVSNAAEVDRAGTDDGRVRIRFADTMPMSTYLVAFVVGPLEATEVHLVAGTAGPIPLRIVHPPGSAHLCAFALEVADAGLRFLERYYDLPYPGDKVDLVAVPDFAFGAMENLGCITFREVLLLVDPERATQQELQRVADVVNHELAHMWFGDLVTMGWWNGIWLNEAFATFMEVAATDSFRPEWDCWTSFGLARAEAFDTDTLHATRPIEFPVHSPADAEAMFDVLTYEKGASVVRMLEQYLGAEPFRAGISEYLRRHAYANTETTDLWDALEETTGEPVRRIMDAWIFRGGHPRVVVTPTEDGVRLAQERSSYDRTDSTDTPDRPDTTDSTDGAATWPVPMVVTARVDDRLQHHRVLLEDPVDLALGGRPTAVQANTGGSGFYRTVLPVTTTASLAVGEDTSPLERFVLVDDAWAASAGRPVDPGRRGVGPAAGGLAGDGSVGVAATGRSGPGAPSAARPRHPLPGPPGPRPGPGHGRRPARQPGGPARHPHRDRPRPVGGPPGRAGLAVGHGRPGRLHPVAGTGAVPRRCRHRAQRRRGAGGRRPGRGGRHRRRRRPRRHRGPLAELGHPPGGDPVPVRAGRHSGAGAVRPDPRAGPDRGPLPERALPPAPRPGPPGPG